MMMDLSGDMPVTLVIKAPNQRMADQTVDCMLGWTIKKLKQHLETVYPSKPKHNEQRLIYSGRLLQDHLTLKEILRQYDDAEFSSKHTVHLVCSSASDSSTSSSSSSLPAKNGNGNASQPATSSPSQGNPSSSENRNSTETMATSQGEGLRYRGQGQPPDMPTTPVTTSTYTAYPMYQPAAAMGGDTAAGYPGYPVSPEQYAWMMHQQQVYSQYMMQYMQYYQSHYNPGQSFNPQMPPSPFLQQPLAGASLPPQLQQPQQQPQAQPAAAANNNGGGGAAGAARQNVRMNAQGGMEEDDDDEGEPRDWLHHTYFFMRFLTFMGILFFYSNLTRFLIVFTGSFAIYFLQKLRKYMQRAQREQEQQQQQQQQQQEQNQQQQNEQEDQQQPQSENSSEESQDPERRNSEENPVPDTETTDNNQPQQEPEDEQGRITRTFMFICNTIQTFFTSLLPTPPELLDAN